MQATLLLIAIAIAAELVNSYSPITAIRGVIGPKNLRNTLNSTKLDDENDTVTNSLGSLHELPDSGESRDIINSVSDELCMRADRSSSDLANAVVTASADAMSEGIKLDDGAHSIISSSELQQTLQDSIKVFQQSKEQTIKLGWKLVHENDLFTLFKRRLPTDEGTPGPVQYMMKGTLNDVSPRAFLHAQLNKAIREGWDTTMAAMASDPDASVEDALDDFIMDGADSLEDKIYYRTKWPWPLKDRDYTLARRAVFYDEYEAIVFVSRASEIPAFQKRENGVIRVENYWCQSAYFSPNKYKDGDGQSEVLASNNAGESSKTSEHANYDLESIDSNSNNSNESDALKQKERKPLRVFLQNTQSSLSKNVGNPKDFAGNVANRIGKSAHNSFNFGQKALNNKLNQGDVTRDTSNSKSRRKLSAEEIKASILSRPGTGFVTIFCDDAKVPLPTRIIDLIATQAEKQVPESINKLHQAAQKIPKQT